MIYFCCDERRREAVGKHPTLMGIDFLEVEDSQAKLHIHFVPAADGVVKTVVPPNVNKEQVKIKGGERIRSIRVVDDPVYDGDVLIVSVDDDSISANGVGDFSIYTLELINVPWLDPQLAATDFSFKVECPSDFDCQKSCDCPPAPGSTPEIDYLTKDYASFRQLMLDRISTLVPQWQERNPADLGVALVELLAYVGDHLSYQQDAVATEAYLGTARKRVSVRRHARLVDYFMHDGANARAWVQVQVSTNEVTLPIGTQMFTQVHGQPARLSPDSRAVEEAFAARPVVFETLHSVLLFESHNEIHFYTGGDEACCLPRHATRAVLLDDENPAKRLRLRKGDVLVFEEQLGPRTGHPADANPVHRHAVRLTNVKPEASSVTLNGQEIGRTPGMILKDSLTGDAYVEVEWAVDDALPFPLCITSVANNKPGGARLKNVSVARGNIVLVDHGQSVSEDLDPVPEPDSRLIRVPSQPACRCDDEKAERQRQRLQTPPRYRPRLRRGPLTQAALFSISRIVEGKRQTLQVPFDPTASAAAAMRWTMEQVMPSIQLDNGLWLPRRDLLSSDQDARELVVEVESDGTASLRFGDGRNGMRPTSGTHFKARYRVGNGVAGNVGAATIAHVVTGDPAVTGVRNPLSARGGCEPESIERVRQDAPSAFRRQERAVTEADYVEVAERHPGVQRAAATFRWTGSWYTVYITVDRLGAELVDAVFKTDIRRHLERYRMTGFDLEIDGPKFVSLDIEIHVCVRPDYFRSSVKAALLDVFSNRDLPDGRRGVFHPDNFSFGEPVYLSRLIAAAQQVTGVESVRVRKFERQGQRSDEALESGRLNIGRLEIARLDNDPNFRERGVFSLDVGGGK